MVTLSLAPSVKGRYTPKLVESYVLEFWKLNRIYEEVKRAACSEGAPVFKFLEGPPTANGFMHVGHARGRTFKDVILRYMRMKGFCVWDQGGWDTQGLPVELEVEKSLKFKSKKDIENYGIDRFIHQCQKIVDFYIGHWREASIKLGLWLDYDNAYETRHPRYIDSVWKFLKAMWEKNYLYEDLRVVPVCPRCETALSSHEVALGYKNIKDPSLYFKVHLVDEPSTYMIAWTTTPWTIIANEALAVHPNERYAKIKVGNEYWIIAEKRLQSFINEIGLKEFAIVDAFLGSSLFNKKYHHPLKNEVPEHENHEPINHRILIAEWVSMDEGSGIVHIAPAHGPEDFELCKKYGIKIFKPIQKNGVFSDHAGKYAEKWFRDVNTLVIEDLKRKNLVAHLGEIEHEYPHCWRCETPLIYYADRQWFIRIDPIKNSMIIENRKVVWYPDWAGKRFEDWINNARDWCISRERYWGTPLPIWTCGECGYRLAFGSIEELHRYATTPLQDIHRPWIDSIIIKCPKCKGEMRREPYVVDVWLDSGMAHTASLSQIRLIDRMAQLFPYDWITEAIDQTRGWFYTLLFTSVALYNLAPYKAVLCQGHVLDKYGKKMSKSRGNVIWAYDFMEKHGADVLRLYLVSKAAPWDNINFDPDEVRDVKSVLDILWNSINFADTYMGLDRWSSSSISKDLSHLLPVDHWLLYELNDLIKNVEQAIESKELHKAVRNIFNFIVETLSHRYITVIRPRVWLEEEAVEKRSAYATLYISLSTVIRLLAPFAPFVTEYLYQYFIKKYAPPSSAKSSVHLESWPSLEEKLLDETYWKAVMLLFNVSEEILSIRAKNNIKRRWPLKKAVIRLKNPTEAEIFDRAKDVIQIYANIKEVITTDRDVSTNNMVRVVDSPIEVYIDASIDEDVVLEGLARDLIRRIQMFRKEASLPVDHIIDSAIIFTPSETMSKAIAKHKQHIERETRIKEILLVNGAPDKSIRWTIEENDLYIVFNV
ncbi:MAG: isoleucine--tRNA ligase [Ignisphaera sp.]|nr:isoleucine--tRNA ligase [Ignisphaera sp.]MCX8167865.1 isoleucine--tRNA ligase [Ignisphaera sp.]MDW8085494.1 isoleucine--tRNA ligase [Ignisphaera sp.]